jgi:hypothetical protein
MRILPLFLVLALVLASRVSIGAPHCDQIDETFCVPTENCPQRWVQFQGNCENQPPDRYWRCAWLCGTQVVYSDYIPCGCGSSPHCDCLLPGTPIMLADGSTRRIEAVQVGDRILGFDESMHVPIVSTVTSVHPPLVAKYYYLINDRIRITESHPVLSDGNWVLVRDLKIGDRLTKADGSPQGIWSIRRVDEPAQTYSIAVSSGTYVANGVVVHNKEVCEDFYLMPDWPK